MKGPEFMRVIGQIAEDNRVEDTEAVNATMRACVFFALEAGISRERFLQFAEESWDVGTVIYKEANATLEDVR